MCFLRRDGRRLRPSVRPADAAVCLGTRPVGCPEPETPAKEKWGLPVLPAAVPDDPWGDAYAMVPIELDWSKVGGGAYDKR